MTGVHTLGAYPPNSWLLLDNPILLKHMLTWLQARKEETNVAICDTSGRLHTNYKLMEELAKCHRSIQKKIKGAPQEVLLVLDGTTGDFSSSDPFPHWKEEGGMGATANFEVCMCL